MLRHRIREGPHHGAGFGVTVRCTAVLNSDTLDTAGEVGLPVFTFSSHFLFGRQVIPPAQVFQQLVVELRIAVVDIATHRCRAFGQQVDAVALDAKAGAEAHAAFHHGHAGIVEVRGARVTEFRGAPARPRQTVVVAIGRTALGTQVLKTEGVPVLLVLFQPLWALAGVADGPHTSVNFTQYVFDHRSIAIHRDVFHELIAKAELIGKQVHDFVVRLRFKQRLDDLVTPLNRAIGGGHATGGFKLRGSGQQVDAVGAVVHDGRDSGIRVDDDHHLQFLHRLLHFNAAGLRVDRVAPVEHRFQRGALGDVFVLFQHAIYPTRYGNTAGVHGLAVGVLGVVEAAFQPLVVYVPHIGPVLPSAFC